MSLSHLFSPIFSLVLGVAVVAQDPVADTLTKLSLEQKAGQLFMSWSLSRPEGDNHEQMLRWVEEVGLGGVILSLGTVEDAATLIPKLQAKARVPLLLAGDFEGGVWFRLDGATELGNQMLVGATSSPYFAEAMGRVTGIEAKALGFHWVFAPVLDVNSNPANPIINVRSFGEDPQLVARLGTAFARGVRQAGLIACGKHFPGHGDVDSDSHLELPTVPGDADRLRSVELLPFRAAAKEGLESVMTGHLAVPGLGEAKDVPATLSSKILRGVLRDELGFTGLVVTDALEMGGVKNAYPPGEVAVRALLAGADVLLMPPDPLAAREAVVSAVKSGRVPMARLNDAVGRILAMKYRVGLMSGGGLVAEDWRERLATEQAQDLARQIARTGPVLVRDRDGSIDALQDGALLVTLVDKDEGQGRVFEERMRFDLPSQRGQPPVAADAGASLRLSGQSTAQEVEAVVANVAMAECVVLSLFVKVREFTGGVAIPPNLKPVIDALTDQQKVTVVSFGNPYLVRDLPHADAYVAAFAATKYVQRMVADGLRGAECLVGRLPVSIPGVAPRGAGLSRYRAFGPDTARPEEVGMAPGLESRLRARLERAVADGAFPGAVCHVTRHGLDVVEVAVGRETYKQDSPRVTGQTRYDLASLTKVCATTPAVLRLVAAGKLSLGDRVGKWVPQFQGLGKDRVTIRHLLTHQGGLVAHVPFYRSLEGRKAVAVAAANEPLVAEPGSAVRYSDLGFILLMAVVEAASQSTFEDYLSREVWGPLHLDQAMVFAPRGSAPIDAAATEDDPARGGVVQGYVHDENAYAMGGVSGHAGVFAAAGAVADYGAVLLGGGNRYLPRELVALATQPAGLGKGTTRGLGFQMLSSGGYAGTDVPDGTFGHTGFTGTSLWCCPRYDVCVVLLTNRVHPTRTNRQITGVRRDVHDIVLNSVR